MNFIESIVLGIIQGLTEFLPVSSSGHLVVAQRLFQIATTNDIAFEVIVHLGTLVSVIAIYYYDIGKMITSFFSGLMKFKLKESYKKDFHFRLSIYVLTGTIPAVIVGLLFKDYFERIFHEVTLVGFTLIITGVILFLTRFVKNDNKALGFWKIITIGIGQAVAIFPGISRSGTTISTSLFLGIKREEAARFSFLLSIPAITGAAVLEIKDLIEVGLDSQQLGLLAIGFFSSFIVGYLAIRFLLRVIKTGKFSWFAPYCVALGILVLTIL